MSNKKQWGAHDIPNLDGQVIIVTGATSGLGKTAAKILSSKGAEVIMAIRNMDKGAAVAKEITKEFPKAKLAVRRLDLGNLSSVRNFASTIQSEYKRLDVLINNAGVMSCPYATTADGFEIQMGTNHLGHFALAGLLMPLLKGTKDSRIVVTSSIAHKFAKINLDDINWEKRTYKTQSAYCDSKMANLLFMQEYVKRYADDPEMPRIAAAHPGWTATELQRHDFMSRVLNPVFAQGPDDGVLPTLRAGFGADTKNSDFFGPKGFWELTGAPVRVSITGDGRNSATAAKLWDISEKLTDVRYE